MLLRSAMRAAACNTPRTQMGCGVGSHAPQLVLSNLDALTGRHSAAILPVTQALVSLPAAAAVVAVAAAPSAAAQRALSLRCYSSAQASSSAPETTSGPRKLKYNLRQLNQDDVEYTFARSGGAGGQNVNKVNTKVDMRFDLDKAGWIPDEVKDAIRRAEKNRFTKEGVLVMTSTRHRTQSQNLDDCMAKLQAMIDAAVEAVTPKEIDPETVKRVKAAIKAGNERRLDTKKKDSKKKSERRRRDFD